MADLFEGAPPAWLQNFGENAYNFIDNDVFDWVYKKSLANKPPEAMGSAIDAVYQGANRAMTTGGPQYNRQEPVRREVVNQPEYMNLRTRLSDSRLPDGNGA